ncbi:MAG: membrane protein insertase YidC, partial [Mariprofundus sp.]
MEQRNMILAFALSMVVLLGWGALFPEQPRPVTEQAQSADDSTASIPGETAPLTDMTTELAPVATATPVPASAAETAATPIVASTGASFAISNDLMQLSLND